MHTPQVRAVDRDHAAARAAFERPGGNQNFVVPSRCSRGVGVFLNISAKFWRKYGISRRSGFPRRLETVVSKEDRAAVRAAEDEQTLKTLGRLRAEVCALRRAATRAVSAPVARAAPGAPGAKKRRGRRPRLALGGDAVHASKLARLLRDLHEQAADLAAPPPPRALDEATFAGGWPGADASTEDVAAALATSASKL